jgi:hypothetical protein
MHIGIGMITFLSPMSPLLHVALKGRQAVELMVVNGYVNTKEAMLDVLGWIEQSIRFRGRIAFKISMRNTYI